MSIVPVVLVAVQFGCIGWLLWFAEWGRLDWLALLLIIFGVMVGGWAIYVMRVSKFHITPEVDKNAILVAAGPYKFIRHPMYSAVLLVCLGFLIMNVNVVSGAVYMVLVADLLLKLRYEEKLLLKHFTEYRDYMNKTKRLIPLVF